MGWDRRREGRRLEAQAVDVDDEMAHLAPDGAVDRIADGRIDLAGDLRDRDAERDVEVEGDVDAARDPDGQARLHETGPTEEPLDGSACEPGDAVRTEGGRPDHVRDGAAGHERAAGG